MNIFNSIIGFFTGGSGTADSVIDGVKRAGDMLVFTDEEKALSNQTALKLLIEYQRATLPQNVARRKIALVVVAMWALMIVFTIFIATIGILSNLENFKILSEYLYRFFDKILNVPFMMIIGFYFLKRIIPSKND